MPRLRSRSLPILVRFWKHEFAFFVPLCRVQCRKLHGGIVLTKVNDYPSKKPYRPPEFRVYGDIRTITQAVNHMGTKVDPNFPAGMRMKTLV